MSKKNILITGSTGFIGRNLVVGLGKQYNLYCIIRSELNPAILTKNGNIFYIKNDYKLINELMQKIKFEGIVHLATLYKHSVTFEDIDGMIESNITFGSKILDLASKNGVNWFLNTGSYMEYFSSKSYSPTNFYASTKKAFEDVGKYYSDSCLINFTTLNLVGTYGPGDNRKKIIDIFLNALNTGEILHLSPGHQEINLLFIEDVIRAYDIFIKLLIKNAKNCNGKYFQISSPENINLVQLADIFESITEKKLRIKWGSLPYRFRENMKINFFGKKLPGWENETSLKLGIKKLLNI